MNALADAKVADYLQSHFVATYLKVGTFQIVGDRKVGGNVACYFCLPDGTVLHAVPGPANGPTFLKEARWAWEIRKSTLTHATDLVTGQIDKGRWQSEVKKAHEERFVAATNPQLARKLRVGAMAGAQNGNNAHANVPLPADLPRHVNQQTQVHWLLATRPLERIGQIYPIVWQEILREQLSNLPVAMR